MNYTPIRIRRRSLPERLFRLPFTFWQLYRVGRPHLNRWQRLRVACAFLPMTVATVPSSAQAPEPAAGTLPTERPWS